MITDDKAVMLNLYREFSSRFCALDFKGMTYKQLDTDITENPVLFLQICAPNKEQCIEFLKRNDYADLIRKLLMYCELTETLKDACKPFLNEESFEHIRSEFVNAQNHLSYQWQEDGLVFLAPEFFIDIVLFPISQFHNMIMRTIFDLHIFDYRLKKMKLFLNAHSPSIFTQFIQYWVAEKTNIDLNLKNIMVR